MEIKLFNKNVQLSLTKRREVANFLFIHLEKYGDPEHEILEAINYAISDSTSKGGFLLVGYVDSQIVGAVVINHTGMKNYIPENILVYIATHKDHRGQGIGKQLIKHTIDTSKGNIAMHVDADNPALKLYEKLGFQNKYLEMRLLKQ